MDAIEEKLLEALARAAVAEKVAERALALAQDCLVKVEILRAMPINNLPSAPLPDPFAEPEMKNLTEDAPIRLSPFAASFSARAAQTAKEASENLETSLNTNEQIWDKETDS